MKFALLGVLNLCLAVRAAQVQLGDPQAIDVVRLVSGESFLPDARSSQFARCMGFAIMGVLLSLVAVCALQSMQVDKRKAILDELERLDELEAKLQEEESAEDHVDLEGTPNEPTQVLEKVRPPVGEKQSAPVVQRVTDASNGVFQKLSKSVMSQIGPKLSKGEPVKHALQERARSFTSKARDFVVKELNDTAGSILNAIDSEESLVMLDWNRTLDMDFPSVPALLAGVFSPPVLNFAFWSHLLQLSCVIAPVLVLCVWSMFVDRFTNCAIPTVFAWQVVQVIIALVLAVAHAVLAVKVFFGKRELQTLEEQTRNRVQGARDLAAKTGDHTLSDIRELVVAHVVLLQQSLLIEDDLRMSKWNSVVGVGSGLWLVVILWNFVLVLGWTFVPGTVAFHPLVANLSGSDYCGAWATVFAGRLTCLFAVLTVPMNIADFVQWVIRDLVVHNEDRTVRMLSLAKSFDCDHLAGIPLAQTLVRAFVLRGAEDTPAAKLCVCTQEWSLLERDRRAVDARLEEVQAKIASCHQVVDDLEPKVAALGGNELEANMLRLESNKFDSADWKRRGQAAIARVEESYSNETQKSASTKDIERLLEQVVSKAERLKQMQFVQDAVHKAAVVTEQVTEMGAEATSSAVDAVNKSSGWKWF